MTLPLQQTRIEFHQNIFLLWGLGQLPTNISKLCMLILLPASIVWVLALEWSLWSPPVGAPPGFPSLRPVGAWERERKREYMYTACSHCIAMVHTCLSELPFNHVLYVLHTYVRMYYTVEPLYRGHHQDPASCPVYSGTSLQRTPLGSSWLSCIQWSLSIVDIIGTQLAVL